MLGGRTRVSKRVDDEEVEAWWECRTQHNEGNNLGKKHLDMELSERRKADGIYSEKATTVKKQ